MAKSHPVLAIGMVDLSYIAGLIDGEGCFDVHVDNRSHSLFPRIRVEMIERETIEWLQSKIPGTKITTANRPNNPAHSSTFRWNVQGRRALLVAQLLLPYLKGKRDQAEMLLQFPYPSSGYVCRSRPNHPEILKERVRVHDELRRLKTKGKGRILGRYFYQEGVSTNGN